MAKLDIAISDVAEIKRFYRNFTVSGSGTISGSMVLPTGYKALGPGFYWSPSVSGNKVHFDYLYSSNDSIEFYGSSEGAGNLQIIAIGMAALKDSGSQEIS
jgi:hypothetical protein